MSALFWHVRCVLTRLPTPRRVHHFDELSATTCSHLPVTGGYLSLSLSSFLLPPVLVGMTFVSLADDYNDKRRAPRSRPYVNMHAVIIACFNVVNGQCCSFCPVLSSSYSELLKQNVVGVEPINGRMYPQEL